MIAKFKTTTGKIIVTLPNTVHELTFGQLMALQAAPNLNNLETISILSGVHINQLQNIVIVNDLQVFNNQANLLATQIEGLNTGNAPPQKVTFIIDAKPVTVKVMKNLSVEPAGAFMAAREIIADEIAKHIQQHGEANWQQNFNPSLTACAQILAQYFYCRATGKPYNEYEAAAFDEHVKQLPVTDALPIAKYFFLSYPNLSKPKTGFWQRQQRLWSSARALNNLPPLNTLTP